MNIISLYRSLNSSAITVGTYNTVVLPEYPDYRIGKDFDGNPCLLLSMHFNSNEVTFKNFRFKYIQIEHNIECRIYEVDFSRFLCVTIITFRCSDSSLQEYFLRMSETLIKTIGKYPDPHQVIDSLNKFVEIFKPLSDFPVNSINGLWAELFLISISKYPSLLIDYWHNIPEEKFDFNADTERIEVKSSSTFERFHYFSAEQLNPLTNTQVLVASVFLKQHSSGVNVFTLVDRITKKTNCNFEVIEKLNRIIFRTLGNSIEHAFGIKFDYEIAQKSLRYYKHQDISKINSSNIPKEVSDVKFLSDLTDVPSVKLNDLPNKGVLFSSL